MVIIWSQAVIWSAVSFRCRRTWNIVIFAWVWAVHLFAHKLFFNSNKHQGAPSNETTYRRFHAFANSQTWKCYFSCLKPGLSMPIDCGFLAEQSRKVNIANKRKIKPYPATFAICNITWCECTFDSLSKGFTTLSIRWWWNQSRSNYPKNIEKSSCRVSDRVPALELFEWRRARPDSRKISLGKNCLHSLTNN